MDPELQIILGPYSKPVPDVFPGTQSVAHKIALSLELSDVMGLNQNKIACKFNPATVIKIIPKISRHSLLPFSVISRTSE